MIKLRTQEVIRKLLEIIGEKIETIKVGIGTRIEFLSKLLRKFQEKIGGRGRLLKLS